MTDGDRSALAAPAGHHSPEAGPERCLLGPSGSLGRDHQQKGASHDHRRLYHGALLSGR